jgi:hypothetical protein
MNKEITVIDLFKRIEKHEDIPKKIKYKDNCYIFKHTNYSIDHLYELIGHECIGWLEHKDINLFDEVEILEDNTEEIEEIEELNGSRFVLTPLDEEIIDRINKLVNATNKIRKDLNK